MLLFLALIFLLGILLWKKMGNKNSSPRRFFTSSSYDDHGYPQPQSPYPATLHHPRSTPRHHHAPLAYRLALPSPLPPRRLLDRKFSRIDDNYQTLDQVTDALSRSGLESSNLIVGIDFTKSNEWTGAKSFNRKSLHTIGPSPNPYEQAISIIGKTLSAFDDDNLIPCFGFGDASTHDQDVFSFYQDGRFCEGFEEVLARYRDLVPQLRLSGPTSFAPVIEMAMSIVEESRGQYHVLLIIADGQVTRSIDTPNDQLSGQERQTVDAIVKASGCLKYVIVMSLACEARDSLLFRALARHERINVYCYYPLSIVVVGVGDGPWDIMKEFDDNLPQRAFDNFQFVNFTDIMSKHVEQSRKEAEFALSALMEIPTQYQATLELNILGHQTGEAPNRTALPPPFSRSNSRYNPYSSSTFQRNVQSGSSSTSPYNNKICPICLTNTKDMAFGCGHQTCCECGVDLEDCPLCRSKITTRIKLYS